MPLATGRAHQSIRLGNMWEENGRRFDRALSLLEPFPEAVDEIALFTSDTHAPLPLDTLRQRVEALAPCIEKARAKGYRCGINHLAFIGHHQEFAEGSLKDADFHVDIHGQTHPGSLCMNSPRTLDYVRESVAILLKAEPDFLWIDDDVRFFHNGRRCFCDGCLETFQKETGLSVTRETLRQAFAKNDAASQPIRDRWREHNAAVLSRFFQAVREAADAVNPQTVLGAMSCEYLEEGYPYARCADILSHGGQTPMKWRPGGGMWNDDRLRGFIEKAHVLGRQSAALPAYVSDIQSEVENFPYQYLNKGAAANMLESALYIAAGCTGNAFNITPFYDEPLDTIVPTLRRAHDLRPFFDRLAAVIGRVSPQGIGTGWTPKTFFCRTPLSEDWPVNLLHAEELYAIGLPPAYDSQSTQVYALTEDSVAGLDDAALQDILSGGVYGDAGAVSALHRRGFGEYTGFQVKEYIPQDVMERYTAHPVNNGVAGHRRNCRQSFTPLPAAVFIPAPGAEIVADLVDYAGVKRAGCCMGVYQNTLGGRFCAAGYFPWSQQQEYGKTRQLKQLFSWLSGGALPAYVSSYHRANIWARQLPDGHTAVVLVNAGLDPAEEIELCVKSADPAGRFYAMSACRKEPGGRKLEAALCKDGLLHFTLPPLAPWEVCLLVTE